MLNRPFFKNAIPVLIDHGHFLVFFYIVIVTSFIFGSLAWITMHVSSPKMAPSRLRSRIWSGWFGAYYLSITQRFE